MNAIYVYSAGKMSQQWNDTTTDNSTANNIVDQTLTGNPNSMGNFLAGSLNMASMQNSWGSGDSFVVLTPPIVPFNQDTARGTLAVDGTTVAEANEWYHNLPNLTGSNPSNSTAAVPGVRYVYNVADTVLPGYNGAKMMIGFDNQTNGTKSVLCNGGLSTTIVAQGFLPLTTGSGAPAGSDAAGATCRQYAGLSFPSGAPPIHWTPEPFDGASS